MIHMEKSIYGSLFMPCRNVIMQIKHYLYTLGNYSNHAMEIKSVELPDSLLKITSDTTVDIPMFF